MHLQSDYSGGLRGLRHEARRAGGVDPRSTTSTATRDRHAGRRDDTGQADHHHRHARRRRRGRRRPLRGRCAAARPSTRRAIGVYAQDMVEFAPMWKLLAGLRWDQFGGTYRSYATANLGGTKPRRRARRPPSASAPTRCGAGASWSALPADRAAVLPPLLRHLVQHLRRRLPTFDPQGTNTPPEASRNVELGGHRLGRRAASRRASRSSTPRSTTSATPTRTASAPTTTSSPASAMRPAST